MRYLSALLVLPVLVCTVGCGDYRESMMVAPDRQGHAAGKPTGLGQAGPLSNKPTIRKGEMWITMGNGDTLSSIAKAYGVTLKWLIERNQLTNTTTDAERRQEVMVVGERSHRSPPGGRILLASGNAKKLREMREILAPVSVTVVSPAEVGYSPDVVEDGDTFEANAIKKAVAGFAATGLWTLADDSGIEARAIGWRPGVYSARYAGEPCDDEANNRKLIAELSGSGDRYVRYRCVIALARPGEETPCWSGMCDGQHVAEPRGAGGFGYDPYVLIPQLGRTMAELSADEKHALSHRGQAMRQFLAWMHGS